MASRAAPTAALILLAGCVSASSAGESATSGLGAAAGAGTGILFSLSGGVVTLLAFLGGAIADMWHQASGAGGEGILSPRAVASAFFRAFLWPTVILLLLFWLSPNPRQLLRGLARGAGRILSGAPGDPRGRARGSDRGGSSGLPRRSQRSRRR